MNRLGSWLYGLSRDWHWERRWVGVGCSVDPSEINRPCMWGDWYEDDDGTIVVCASLSWGNGNSDPVWSFDLTFRIPKRTRRTAPR